MIRPPAIATEARPLRKSEFAAFQENVSTHVSMYFLFVKYIRKMNAPRNTSTWKLLEKGSNANRMLADGYTLKVNQCFSREATWRGAGEAEKSRHRGDAPSNLADEFFQPQSMLSMSLK